MSATTLTRQTTETSLHPSDLTQTVSVWQWNGFDWKKLDQCAPLWKIQINLFGNQMAFPVDCNPNELADFLYAHNVTDTEKTVARIEAYASTKDLNVTVIYSYNPKRIAPVRYQVKLFGSLQDNIWGCTCPAGIHGKKCKHVTAVKEMYSKKEQLSLSREPMTIERDTQDINDSWHVYYGAADITKQVYLGRLQCRHESKAHEVANSIGDKYFLRMRRRLSNA